MVFITASTILSLWVGVWAARMYMITGGAGTMALSVFFFVLAVVLIWYGLKVFQKLKELA